MPSTVHRPLFAQQRVHWHRRTIGVPRDAFTGTKIITSNDLRVDESDCLGEMWNVNDHRPGNTFVSHTSSPYGKTDLTAQNTRKERYLIASEEEIVYKKIMIDLLKNQISKRRGKITTFDFTRMEQQLWNMQHPTVWKNGI